MARPIRFQYPGAIYHVMASGDGGKVVFERDDDRKAFVCKLGQVGASHGWRVHAWVLMGNHFHLLLETPQANLVTGMQWLLGTYSQGWNRARLRRGHVFQGRYKSVPVIGTDADAYDFRMVADYIHLNPARVGLAGGRRGSLTYDKRGNLLKTKLPGNREHTSTYDSLGRLKTATDPKGQTFTYSHWSSRTGTPPPRTPSAATSPTAWRNPSTTASQRASISTICEMS